MPSAMITTVIAVRNLFPRIFFQESTKASLYVILNVKTKVTEPYLLEANAFINGINGTTIQGAIQEKYRAQLLMLQK